MNPATSTHSIVSAVRSPDCSTGSFGSNLVSFRLGARGAESNRHGDGGAVTQKRQPGPERPLGMAEKKSRESVCSSSSSLATRISDWSPTGPGTSRDRSRLRNHGGMPEARNGERSVLTHPGATVRARTTPRIVALLRLGYAPSGFEATAAEGIGRPFRSSARLFPSVMNGKSVESGSFERRRRSLQPRRGVVRLYDTQRPTQAG